MILLWEKAVKRMEYIDPSMSLWMILLYLFYSFMVAVITVAFASRSLPLTPSLCGQNLAAVMPRGSHLLSCSIVRRISSETSRAGRLEKFLKVFLSVGLCRKKKRLNAYSGIIEPKIHCIASNLPVVNVCTQFENVAAGDCQT